MTRTAVVEVPLRWSDQDAYGHLNNARAVTLLEEARIKLLWRAPGAGAGGVGAPSLRDGLIVVGLNVEYRRQVRFRTDLLLRVAMAVDEVRAASFRITYDVHDGADDDAPLAIRAWTSMALFDMDKQRPRRLGADEKAYLNGAAPNEAAPNEAAPNRAARDGAARDGAVSNGAVSNGAGRSRSADPGVRS